VWKEPGDWNRLASFVVSARVAAGYKERRAFARAIGVTERTLGKLENGYSVSAPTLASVEQGVGWKPDSARRVLHGGEPDTVSPSAHGRPRYDDPEEDAHAADMWEVGRRRYDEESLRDFIEGVILKHRRQRGTPPAEERHRRAAG
jgi:hypothetical protein